MCIRDRSFCQLPQHTIAIHDQQQLPICHHKMPVHNSEGQIIGIMGTVELYNHEKALKSADSAIAKAVERLLSRPETFSSVSELAREVGMSRRNFNRRFKEETSLTPSQFLGRRRIQLACQLLRNETEKNISDIALEIGFCDQSAFTTQFRERMGTTPYKYRQAYEPNELNPMDRINIP